MDKESIAQKIIKLLSEEKLTYDEAWEVMSYTSSRMQVSSRIYLQKRGEASLTEIMGEVSDYLSSSKGKSPDITTSSERSPLG